jgi:hypothetical protein
VQLVFLAYADLNQALLGKNIDAMMQSEPQSSQAINKGFGTEMIKPYDTPIGEPIRTMVMTEKFYKEKRPLAEKFMRCFVQATKTFIENKALAEKYVREVVFKGQITKRRLRRRDRQFAVFLRHHARTHPDHHRHHGQDRRRPHGQAAGGQGLGQDRPAGRGQEKPERQIRRDGGSS